MSSEWVLVGAFLLCALSTGYLTAHLTTQYLQRRARRALPLEEHAGRFGACRLCIRRMQEAPEMAYATLLEHDEWENAAQARAEAVLIDHLNDAQRRSYRALGMFDLVGRRGNRYQVSRSGAAFVNGNYACIAPVGELPPADVALAAKLLIEADEEAFLRTANIGGHAGWKMTIDGQITVGGKRSPYLQRRRA